MKYTNLNLLHDGKLFEYKVGYEETQQLRTTPYLKYNTSYLSSTNTNIVQFFDSNTSLYNRINTWTLYDPEIGHKLYLPADYSTNADEIYNKYIYEGCIFYNEYNDIINEMPSTINIANVKVFFPDYSLDSVLSNISYALTVYMWINGFKVILGSYKLDRYNAQAITSDFDKLKGYYEEISIDIIDPKSLLYHDDWKYFREVVCAEKILSNYEGTGLCFSLDPIEYNEEDDIYSCVLSCAGGENTIIVSNYEKDDMNLSISHNINNLYATPAIKFKLNFNEAYFDNNLYYQTIDDLKDYLFETYDIPIYDVRISYDLSIKNDDEVFFYNTMSSDDIECSFENIDEISLSNFERISWDWFKSYDSLNDKPLYLQGLANIYIKKDENDTEHLFLYLKSNQIPLTQELISYFTNPRTSISDELNNFWKIKKVNLNDINMNIYNINAVNKTENIIKHFDYVNNDSKSNIVQPIFYKVQPLSGISIHSGVTENIAINLDSYKSKVKTFKLKLGSSVFIEAGRVKTGIVFIIKANKLDGLLSAGNYFILNERDEVVTSGKYTYS